MSNAVSSVLVTGAGKPGTSATITALRRSGYRVLAVDSAPEASGLGKADRAYVVPAGSQAGFVEELTRVCLHERVRAIVPLVDEELVDEELVAVWELSRLGIQILSPRLSLVALCLDRLQLTEVLRLCRVRTPRTRLASKGAGDLSFPMVLTDRYKTGQVSPARVAQDMQALDGLLFEHRAHLGRLLIQEHVPGPEYSVSVVVWRDGNVQAVVPKEIVYRKGAAHYAVTRRQEALTQACAETARVLDADGPISVRARLDAAGDPHVFDIAPRLTRTSSLTVSAGVDEVRGLLDQALTGGGPTLKNSWREGITLPLQDSGASPHQPALDPHDQTLEKNG
ncbi:ATP-grasp domain-containing protein [Nocardiopsis metallicus]|uniref:Carbamoyl-phosphate synthase large subunit n=2 Tax=Nocardiopsis metallicus TaxID=179819 RepID=A0A840WKS5_9ACTN|nr:ATP-grasp domain-containing protein [Nocardiopsis metallicus]MBB5492236.1 carbamoyl-phosphate synthase large subunit [Nocardiopsis metallicus]